MKVLVYGATGSQAKPVVHELLRKGHIPVAFTRNRSKAADLEAAGAEIFVGDMTDPQATQAATQGVDRIALLIPSFTQDRLSASQTAIEAAKAASIELIVWNASGPIPPEQSGDPMADARLITQQHLAASSIPHVIFQPTVYAENLLGPWTAPFVQNQNQVAYPTPPDFQIGWLPSADMGKAVVAALEKPELAGQNFTMSGMETLNGLELAAAFSEGLGRPIEYYPMPPADFGQIIDQVMGPGAGEGVSAQYQAIWNGEASPMMYAEMEKTLATLEVAFTPLANWVREHSFLFSPQE